MSNRTLNVDEIIEKYLRDNRYDGLHDGVSCRCKATEIYICNKYCESPNFCHPAYKITPRSKECKACRERGCCERIGIGVQVYGKPFSKGFCTAGCLRPADEKDLNLCDTCAKDYQECKAVNVFFGYGEGNDNIIRCSEYEESPRIKPTKESK